ncbi:hypothetical protein X946_1563 [Burkholderia sp. ABCPW 111]|nr:hypothetical protein X946_1563 [Burkholderia sp. ABCPW 111]
MSIEICDRQPCAFFEWDEYSILPEKEKQSLQAAARSMAQI